MLFSRNLEKRRKTKGHVLTHSSMSGRRRKHRSGWADRRGPMAMRVREAEQGHPVAPCGLLPTKLFSGAAPALRSPFSIFAKPLALETWPLLAMSISMRIMTSSGPYAILPSSHPPAGRRRRPFLKSLAPGVRQAPSASCASHIRIREKRARPAHEKQREH